MTGKEDPAAFAARRAAARARIDPLAKRYMGEKGDRRHFFQAIYDTAGGDAAGIPWADLEPKKEIADWLGDNPGHGRTALDIACGLGDHAEAIAAAGYRTCAFDISEKAVAWARQRFPESNVDYRTADLLDLPKSWQTGFDLVNECYTVQSVPPPLHRRFVEAISSLVAPGGTLLVYARTRPQGGEHEGPPWPLMPSELEFFRGFGLRRVGEDFFSVNRSDRVVPHVFAVWQRTG